MIVQPNLLIDVELLINQKIALLNVIEQLSNPLEIEYLNGILGILDAISDEIYTDNFDIL